MIDFVIKIQKINNRLTILLSHFQISNYKFSTKEATISIQKHVALIRGHRAKSQIFLPPVQTIKNPTTIDLEFEMKFQIQGLKKGGGEGEIQSTTEENQNIPPLVSRNENCQLPRSAMIFKESPGGDETNSPTITGFFFPLTAKIYDNDFTSRCIVS